MCKFLNEQSRGAERGFGSAQSIDGSAIPRPASIPDSQSRALLSADKFEMHFVEPNSTNPQNIRDSGTTLLKAIGRRVS